MKSNYFKYIAERCKIALGIVAGSSLLIRRFRAKKKKKQSTEKSHFPQYSPLLPGHMSRLLETMLPNKGTYCGVANRYSER